MKTDVYLKDPIEKGIWIRDIKNFRWDNDSQVLIFEDNLGMECVVPRCSVLRVVTTYDKDEMDDKGKWTKFEPSKRIRES